MENKNANFHQLINDIKLTFQLNRQFPSGFYYLKCPICQKGDAGFYFDQESIVFNCFRAKCGFKTVYNKESHVPRKFRQLMEEGGIEIPPSLLFASKQEKKIEEEINHRLYKPTTYEHVGVPEYFQKVTKKQHGFIIDYLASRNIDFDEISHELYTSHQGKWLNRIIFPMYFQNKIIGFQGKKIKNNTPGQKYETESFKINKSLFYAPLGYIPKKVFLVEGVFDALSIPNSIAILSNSVSKGLAYHLRNHEVIIIPDKENTNAIRDMERYHYHISIPFFKKAKDLNEAIQIYGRIATTKMVVDNITDTSYHARVKMNLWH